MLIPDEQGGLNDVQRPCGVHSLHRASPSGPPTVVAGSVSRCAMVASSSRRSMQVHRHSVSPTTSSHQLPVEVLGFWPGCPAWLA